MGLFYGTLMLLVALVSAAGLLVMPSYFLHTMGDFGIKPLLYYGTDFRRAAAASMSVSLIAIILIGIHVMVACNSRLAASYSAGVILPFVVMSFMFGGLYYRDIVATQNIVINGSMPLVKHYKTPDGKREWGYNLTDWGTFYKECPQANPEYCIRSTFKLKAKEWQKKARKILWIYIGMSAASLLFFYTEKKRLAAVYFVSVTIVLSMWALPVYASAVKTRMPSRMGMENCLDQGHFKMLLIFAWLTAFAAVAVLAFSICQVLILAIIPAVLAVAFCVTVVVFWFKLRHSATRCLYPAWYTEVDILEKLAYPQFAVCLCLAFLAAYAIFASCNDYSEAGFILVIFHADGSITVEDHT